MQLTINTTRDFFEKCAKLHSPWHAILEYFSKITHSDNH